MIAEMKFLVHDAWNWKTQTILIMLPHSNNYRLGKAGGKKKKQKCGYKGTQVWIAEFLEWLMYFLVWHVRKKEIICSLF